MYFPYYGAVVGSNFMVPPLVCRDGCNGKTQCISKTSVECTSLKTELRHVTKLRRICLQCPVKTCVGVVGGWYHTHEQLYDMLLPDFYL